MRKSSARMLKIEKCLKNFAAAFLILVLSLAAASDLAGQEIPLKRGDRLKMTSPQRPDLELYLALDEQGQVYVPIVGGIDVEGLTIETARAILLRRLQEVYPSIESITLVSVAEDYHYYVHGQVVNPGKYKLVITPNVWEAVREAGGATVEASLDAVRLIRAEGNGRRTAVVNLQQAIDTGDFESLPMLKAGDTVIIPAKSMRIGGSGAVNVFGAVMNPAPYSLTEQKTLMDAVLAAGGAAEYANLKKVSIVRMMPEGGSMTITVNLKRYLEEGDLSHNPDVRPGDTVNIPYHSYFFRAITEPTFILGMLTTMVTLTVIAYSR